MVYFAWFFYGFRLVIKSKKTYLDYSINFFGCIIMTFEHTPKTLADLNILLTKHGVRDAIIKPLSKNHNDKNQVYSGSDFKPLTPFFEVEFKERAMSTSLKKGGTENNAQILEATFVNFFWLDQSGNEVRAKSVKMITYPQYPETRMSGFQSIDGTMPESMSVDFTKAHPNRLRYLVMGRRGQGEVLALMVLDPPPNLVEEMKALPNAEKSRVWKYLQVKESGSHRLRELLSQAVATSHRGCRLDTRGNEIPFNGTQVCGYTLERACGIVPNSDKSGDYEGIELKAHTQKKVTLFTPEPDMGVYAESFDTFMKTWGYLDASGNYRLTGIHRSGNVCKKSGLLMTIQNYDPAKSIAEQSNIFVALYDSEQTLAAGWSLERLMNCWGAKHNEVVYVSASRSDAVDEKDISEGYRYRVNFDSQVLWCRKTSIDQLFLAIHKGVIFLDPAPKLHATDKSQSKRRSQWRVNDINQAAKHLYDDTRLESL